MPKELLYTLKKVWVAGQQLKISHFNRETGPKNRPEKRHKKSSAATDNNRKNTKPLQLKRRKKPAKH